MAYDSVRAQLDKLLGADRNGPLTDSATRATPHYTDPTVCKHFLLGFCPNDLPIKHRSEPGSCTDLHCESAKSEFEKDDADGKVNIRDKYLWYRALSKDCASIISDEDHKIRGHARRLQGTYRAQGDLSGLMILNFDTLKKLGMVSVDAKIKVWNEIQDDDDFITDDGTATLLHEEDESKDDSQVLPVKKPSVKSEGALKNSEEGDTEGDQDADDDLDGFGIVKVIPANKNVPEDTDVDEFGRMKNCKRDNVHTNHLSNDDSQSEQSDADGNNHHDNDDDDDDGFDVVKVTPAAPDTNNSNCSPAKKDDAILPQEMPKDHGSPGNGSTESTEKKNSNSESNTPLDSTCHPDKPVETGDDKTVTSSRDDDANAKGKVNETKKTDNLNERNEDKEENSLTPQQIMDKFYEAGEGPDGLMMLDRKQCLRVCACCGGYISLVDAESRLLSHFGGKSHHSLALLREKVFEIEQKVAEFASRVDKSERDRPYPHDDHEMGWSRRAPTNRGRMDRDPNPEAMGLGRWGGDGGRPRGESYGRGDRRNDRGFDRSFRRGAYRRDERDERDQRDYRSGGYGGRNGERNDGGRYEGGRYDGGRNDGGRKRYRSRSPPRPSRRYRRN